MLPVAAIAADRFTDVPDTNVFHDDIAWLADAGVTLGCNPPANDQFCPEVDVSRQQMAAFLRRFAGYIDAEDGTPALADKATTADQATTADHATTADSATTAGDADTLDGLDSSDLLARVPVAQALISRTPSVERGFGITKVTRDSTGVFCLELDPALGLTEADIIVSVTVDWFASFGDDLFAQWSSSSFGNCATGEFMVRTFDNAAGIDESNDVRFSVVVFRADPTAGPEAPRSPVSGAPLSNGS